MVKPYIADHAVKETAWSGSDLAHFFSGLLVAGIDGTLWWFGQATSLLIRQPVFHRQLHHVAARFC
jgi:hypothetical protein